MDLRTLRRAKEIVIRCQNVLIWQTLNYLSTQSGNIVEGLRSRWRMSQGPRWQDLVCLLWGAERGCTSKCSNCAICLVGWIKSVRVGISQKLKLPSLSVWRMWGTTREAMATGLRWEAMGRDPLPGMEATAEVLWPCRRRRCRKRKCVWTESSRRGCTRPRTSAPNTRELLELCSALVSLWSD